MNLEQLESVVASALEPAFRAQLLARGQARSLIWRDGVLPRGAPAFTEMLSYDLIVYGDALLLHAIHLRTQGGDEQLASRAFIQSGEAIEAVVANGDPDDPQRGFLRILAAAAYHLGRSSARAYSLLIKSIHSSNLSQIERGLSFLILRNFNQLEDEITEWKARGEASDERLVEFLSSQEPTVGADAPSDQFEESVLVALNLALCDQFYSGLCYFLLAIETGEKALETRAREELQTGLRVATEMNFVPQWWCFRLAIQLFDDLWQASFHNLLPQDLPDGENPSWLAARSMFIALLCRRSKAEIELWPSQIEGARRAVDTSDNLVVSLPTSAGKTRIAELCILRCLSDGKRVVFVTPLRALSAQSESTLQNTFGPLGYSVSGLYGSVGTSGFEEDTLLKRDIVVATPEKLDFALRNDPTILNDVGLVVLDEGHMIGLGEREVRYEIQIQRLLNREDATQRRIICLSAILPDGNKLDDFTSWIRKGYQGVALKSDWRPTRQRFGEVIWRDRRARLDLRVGGERPFVPTFFRERKPLRGRRTEPFPRDQRELAIATAWRLLEDKQSVLIYCPQRNSVTPYADAIIDLESKGFIESALDVDECILDDVLSIGQEWLGSDHPILRCLKLGVAIHHGALPTPFRIEMERLLRSGALKVTISSPTLAQGLNLSATAVVMHSIHHFRDGGWKIIEASDFHNIVGRAGRAFVDVEGLILYPVFKNHTRSRQEWSGLLAKEGGHDIESGLFELLMIFLKRLHVALGKPDIQELTDYVLNNSEAWDFPVVPRESTKTTNRYAAQWNQYLPVLDTAIFSLVGEEDIPVEELSMRLDQLLSSSLWQKRIARKKESHQTLLKAALVGRANTIWMQSSKAQRRGYFLAGVGLASGQYMDAIATELNPLLIVANAAIVDKDNDRAVDAILELGERLFEIEPFVPDPHLSNWRDVLRLWLLGESLTCYSVNQTDDILRFIENGVVYKLAWAVDAVRVRAVANEDTITVGHDTYNIDELETRDLGSCLERGTLKPCAARLMQAGFTSRLAAIKAVSDTDADFTNARELQEWLRSPDVLTLSQDKNWPTTDSHSRWLEFVNHHVPADRLLWSVHSGEIPVIWHGPTTPRLDDIVRLRIAGNGQCEVLSPTFESLGMSKSKISCQPDGVLTARVCGETSIAYTYRGPMDFSVNE